MREYVILLSSTARKQLDKLDDKTGDKLLLQIEKLSKNPRPPGCKKLKGYSNSWRIRVGDYRIIYEVEDKILRILVIGIGHRKDIYE